MKLLIEEHAELFLHPYRFAVKHKVVVTVF